MANCSQINNTTITGTSAFIYDGTQLPCTDIKTCDDLNTVLAKLDAVVCNVTSSINTLTEDITNITEDIMIIGEDIININNQLNICCPICDFTGTASQLPVCIFTGDANQLPDPTTTTTSSSSSTSTSTTSSTSTSTSTSSTTTTSTSSTTTSTSSTTTSTTTAVPGSTTTTTTTCQVPVFETTNLNVTTYRNGDTIPEYVSVGLGPNPGWAALTTGAWCHVNNDPANDAIYGKLYNWYAVNDSRGLAPTGYHIPTNDEWWCYYYSVNPIGFPNVTGGKMKQTGTSLWASPNTGATNSTGFTALPAGNRNGTTGGFYSPGDFSSFWTSTQFDSTNAYYKACYYYSDDLYTSDEIKSSGYSVRIAQD
jgi:uncharacterized protein (TIGR02145 family)